MPVLQYNNQLYAGDVIANAFGRMMDSARANQIRQAEVARRMQEDQLQAEIEALRLGNEMRKTPSEIARNEASAKYDLERTTTEATGRKSAEDLGSAVWQKSMRDAAGTPQFRTSLFDEEPVSFVPGNAEKVARSVNMADAERAAAVSQALKNPADIGTALGGIRFSMYPSESSFAAMTSKPTINIPAGGLGKNLITGEMIDNPREVGAPNRIPLHERLLDKIVGGLANNDIDENTAEALIARFGLDTGGDSIIPVISPNDKASYDKLKPGRKYRVEPNGTVYTKQ